MATADEEPVVADKAAEVTPESNDVKAEKLKPKKAAAPRKRSPSTHPPFLEMISDAIVTLRERTGSSQYAIQKFIEEKHKQLPGNFRKLLLIQLKRLVASGKLVKVKNSYKLPAARAAASSHPEKPALSKAKPKAAAAKAKPKAAAAKAKPKAAAAKAKPKAAAAKPKPAARPKAKAAPRPKPAAKPKAKVSPKPKAVAKVKLAAKPKAAAPAGKRKSVEKPKSKPPAKSAKTSAKSSPAKKAAKPKKVPAKKPTRPTTPRKASRKK